MTVGVKAIDDTTLEVTFLEDAAYNANIIGLWTAHAVPKWLIEGDDCTEARGDRWTEPGFFQGYGPFTLKEWVHDSYITIIKNPFWPGTPDIPAPKLDEVNCTSCWMRSPPSPSTRPATWTPPPFRWPTSSASRPIPVLSAEYRSAPNLCTYYYGFNTKAPFVDDVRVRQALSMAIDRQGLIDNVLKARPGAGAVVLAPRPGGGADHGRLPGPGRQVRPGGRQGADR